MLDILNIQVTPEEARMIKLALITRTLNYSLENPDENLAEKYSELYEKVAEQTKL